MIIFRTRFGVGTGILQKMNFKLLLACDLDRTIFPNGQAPFSIEALEKFSHLVSDSKICLAYISGRSLSRALKGMEEFNVPVPNIYVGDCGTTIYIRNSDGKFEEHKEWKSEFLDDWGEIRGNNINSLIASIPSLVPQEEDNQNIYKQSYYFPASQQNEIKKEVDEKLLSLNIKFQVITLLEEEDNKGYLDVIPESATKEHALKYLQRYLFVTEDNVIYAGDAGNDLLALTSGCKAIVVNNASPNFKEEVRHVAKNKGLLEKIYFAKGEYDGMNGNYIAGILEGVHYFRF